MSIINQGRTPSEQNRLPIFTSGGQRSSRRAAAAILGLMIAAVAALIIANSVG